MSDSLLKGIGILALIIVALYLLVYVGVPAVGVLLALIWGIAGVLAFLLKVAFFLLLLVGVCVGLVMFFSWLIRELID
jgi:hypothetical protein